MIIFFAELLHGLDGSILDFENGFLIPGAEGSELRDNLPKTLTHITKRDG